MSEPDPTAYRHSVAFVLSQVGAHSAALFADRLKPLGVSPREFAVLSHIASGQPRTQQQLSELLGVHRNNMVSLIDQMETRGWVSRHRGEQDRRSFEIRPTPAGTHILARVNELIPDLDADLTAGLSKRDSRALADLLQAVAANLGLTPAVHPSVSVDRH